MEREFDNTDPLLKIRYRLRAYQRIGWTAVRKGVNPVALVTSRFPFVFPDPPHPASMSLELTDACDLKCLYCPNPLFAFPRAFMSTEVLEAVLGSLQRFGVDRIRVGGGEPTLHPKFAQFSSQLARSTKLLSIVTNGQWRKPETAEALADHYGMIEISIDAGGAEVYEHSRPGSSFVRLQDNLKGLAELLSRKGNAPLVNVRLMLRPSTQHLKAVESKHWGRFADVVMPQYVMKTAESDYTDDVFHPIQTASDAIPRCTLPFKDLQVLVNGDVPMCQFTGRTIIPGKKRIIGNVTRTGLQELWKSEVMRNIRAAHRTRDAASSQICRGCQGC